MSVGYESQVFASCDICHIDEFSSTRTLADFKQMLRLEGWSIGKRTLCPECRKAVKRESQKVLEGEI